MAYDDCSKELSDVIKFNWLNFFLNFLSSPTHFAQTVTTWIGLFVTLVITTIVLNFLVRFEGKYDENLMWSFLVALSFSTSQYGHYWPARSSIKIFLVSLIFYGLHINTAYHSFLISVLTKPRYNIQMASVRDGINRGIQFEADENSAKFFMKEDSVRQLITQLVYFNSIKHSIK